MKSFVRSLLPLLALTAVMSVPTSAKDFEGKIVMESHHGKKVSTVTYLLKSGNLRLEVPTDKGGDAFATIMRPADKQVIILMAEQKQYMVHAFDMEKTVAKAQTMTGKTVSSFEKTGRTEKICGYECVEYQSKSGTDTIENWVVEGFGFFAMPSGGRGGPGASKASEWEAALREKGGFALRTIARDGKGKEKMRMQAVSVEKQRLDEALFKAPIGWTEFKMPSLKDLLGGR